MVIKQIESTMKAWFSPLVMATLVTAMVIGGCAQQTTPAPTPVVVSDAVLVTFGLMSAEPVIIKSE